MSKEHLWITACIVSAIFSVIYATTFIDPVRQPLRDLQRLNKRRATINAALDQVNTGAEKVNAAAKKVEDEERALGDACNDEGGARSRVEGVEQTLHSVQHRLQVAHEELSSAQQVLKGSVEVVSRKQRDESEAEQVLEKDKLQRVAAQEDLDEVQKLTSADLVQSYHDRLTSRLHKAKQRQEMLAVREGRERDQAKEMDEKVEALEKQCMDARDAETQISKLNDPALKAYLESTRITITLQVSRDTLEPSELRDPRELCVRKLGDLQSKSTDESKAKADHESAQKVSFNCGAQPRAAMLLTAESSNLGLSTGRETSAE